MKSTKKSSSASQTFDGYLAALSSDKREALEKLRTVIRSAAPQVEECISYGVPAFRLGGKFFVGLGAGAKHCSFYAGSTLRGFEKELADYEISKGTIRFQPGEPLPVGVIRKLLKMRIAQRHPEKKASSPPAKKSRAASGATKSRSK